MKEVKLGSRRVRAPAGARIREKKQKIKNEEGGVICSPRAQHGRLSLSLLTFFKAFSSRFFVKL